MTVRENKGTKRLVLRIREGIDRDIKSDSKDGMPISTLSTHG